MPVESENAIELPDTDPFEVYDAEIRRLDQHFAACSDADWNKSSRCEGWDTRDVLSHLMCVDLYNLASLDDEIPRMAGFDWDGFIEERRSSLTGELIDEWREGNAEVRRRWEERGLENTVASMVGQYPLRAQVFHMANEIGTHSDDVFVEVAPDDRAARDDWRAVYSRFALDEYSKSVEVEIGAGDVTLTLGDETATLSKQDFVDATVDRLPDHFEKAPSPAMMTALRLIP